MMMKKTKLIVLAAFVTITVAFAGCAALSGAAGDAAGGAVGDATGGATARADGFTSGATARADGLTGDATARAGAASGGAYEPAFTGSRTPLDSLSPYDVKDVPAGKTSTFRFLGTTWVQRVDGKDMLSGSLKFENNVATLTPEYTYSGTVNPITKKALGWVKSPTKLPDVVLAYVPGPPASLSLRK
jgi:hypothetical protein